MSTYFAVKLIHILSATVLFGTGLGTAFFMLRAYLAEDEHAMLPTARSVVLADWLFTTPAVIVQVVTGVWLTQILGVSWGSAWFIAVIGLFGLTGLCWLPVVWIQIRVRELLASGATKDRYRKLMRAWITLGAIAFSSVIVIFYLMVTKTGIAWILLE